MVTTAAEDQMVERVLDLYEVVRYAPMGHASEEDGEVVYTGTIASCREAIAERLDGITLADAAWGPSPDDGDVDVECYSESMEEGCGGWTIRRAEPEV